MAKAKPSVGATGPTKAHTQKESTFEMIDRLTQDLPPKPSAPETGPGTMPPGIRPNRQRGFLKNEQRRENLRKAGR